MMEGIDLQQRALAASQSKTDPANPPVHIPRPNAELKSRQPIPLDSDSDDEIEILSQRAANLSTGAVTNKPKESAVANPNKQSAVPHRIISAANSVNTNTNVVKRPSPAPSTGSTASSSTADYTFFEPVKPKAAPLPIRPLQPQANTQPRPAPAYALQGLSSGLRPLGGPAAAYAQQHQVKPPAALMGENNLFQHIRPAKGFASPARQSAFGNTSPYVTGGGVRPGSGVPGMAARPMYDSQGRPIQPRSLAPTVGPGYPLLPVTVPTSNNADDGEDFSRELAELRTTAEDMQRSADPDADMRELLSGAIGTGEDAPADGAEVVENFAKGVKLMPHQIRGVAWIAQRESGRKNGGILADDMGLGKTIQMTAQIATKLPTAKDKKDGFKAGTLVVVPLAVMEQWKGEIIAKTKPGLLKVTTHHSASRTKSAKVLESFDVVITTFHTLASEHTTYDQRNVKKAADKAGKDSDSDDGSDSTGERFGKSIAKKKKAPRVGTHSALFQTKWFRVVIDEAQNIKNRKTKQAEAAFALQAKYRWCLTGTPIQNNVDELFSLFHFLKAKPFDNWTHFNQVISKPVKAGSTKMAMKRLHVVLKAMMLRRRKDATIDGKPILNLPGRAVEIVECEFDAEERSFYDALEKKTEMTFNKYLKSGTLNSNQMGALVLLLRLRQACSHPSLVLKPAALDKDALDSSKAAEAAAAAAKAGEEETDELADLLGELGVKSETKTCTVCFTTLDDPTLSICAECEPLARRARATSVESGMPPSSAKIRKLVSLLQSVDAKSGEKEKTIVFSQFTSFLDLVEPFLKEKGIKFVRYDGKMRNDKRQASLEAIKSDPTVRVILISFKSGSTGLNLTCCNHVVLMDLWWNPALEDQAFDRAHRLGQKLDVNIYKLTIATTVEDRILNLQEKKRDLATAALSGEAVRNMKLTMNDMIDLFRAQPRQNHEA